MPSPTSNTAKLSNKFKPRRWPYLVIVAWLIAAGLVYLFRQDLYDWWRLQDYQTPSSIITLARDDTMTGYATKLLKINHPKLLNSRSFSTLCPNKGGEKTIVLGCYHGNEAGIYLLKVSDPRLSGVEQVTAAHEMLHAAYDRLSKNDKANVNAMLLKYYRNDLKDPWIKSEIASYQKTEPGYVINEMHSVFGTEVAKLPKDLANYYSRYFTNRQKIVSYAKHYQTELISRQSQVSNADSQLKAMKSSISSLNTTIATKYTQIMAEQAELNQSLNKNDVNSYNNLVGSYDNLVDSYNLAVNQLKDQVNSYNQLVDQRNATALTEDQLYSELRGGYQTISDQP